MTTYETLFRVTITDPTDGAPAGKLADAELEFCGGPLNGLRLIGFGIWSRRGAPSAAAVNVTYPARQYSVNGERRSYALLRPQPIPGSDFVPDAMRDAVIEAYNLWAHPRARVATPAPTPEPVATPEPSTAGQMTRELFDAFLEARDTAAVTMAAPEPVTPNTTTHADLETRERSMLASIIQDRDRAADGPLTAPERATIAHNFGIDLSEGPERPALPTPPAPPVRFVKMTPTPGGRMIAAPRFDKGSAADALMGLL